MRVRLASLLVVVAGSALPACHFPDGGDDSEQPGFDADPTAHDAALAADAAPPDGGGTGAFCGGKGDVPCAADHYCDFDDNSCGAFDSSGHCEPRPPECPAGESTCGCDGQVYWGQCAAASSGYDVDDFGGCATPEGTFACGHLFCNATTQYCRRFVSDIGGWADDWACIDDPGSCPDAGATCDCLVDELCGNDCSATGDGLRLTCYGG